MNVQADLPNGIDGALRIAVSERGPVTTVGLEGEWGLAEKEATREAFRRALAREPDRLILDLSRLSFIDSTGIHTMVELVRRAADLGVRLTIVPGARAVQRIFEICQLAERLTTTGA